MTPQKILSPKYKLAVDLAADLFRDEQREVTGLPYIVHLISVSYIASRLTDDEDVHIAALLHDVLEDVPSSKYSESDMRRDFGDRITDMVKTVSHDDDRYGKQLAREKYLEQIKTGSMEACMVSASDLLHNATDIVDSYQKMPEKVRDRFGGERAERRQWFWSERFKIIKNRLGEDSGVVKELGQALKRVEDINNEIM